MKKYFIVCCALFSFKLFALGPGLVCNTHGGTDKLNVLNENEYPVETCVQENDQNSFIQLGTLDNPMLYASAIIRYLNAHDITSNYETICINDNFKGIVTNYKINDNMVKVCSFSDGSFVSIPLLKNYESVPFIFHK